MRRPHGLLGHISPIKRRPARRSFCETVHRAQRRGLLEMGLGVVVSVLAGIGLRMV